MPDNWRIGDLVKELTECQARLKANRKRLINEPDSRIHELISLINADSCKAYRLKEMIANMEQRRPPLGKSNQIHNTK